MLPEPIRNEDLRSSDVPHTSASWGEIVKFAHTFNGYTFHGSFEVCGTIANERRHETLTDLSGLACFSSNDDGIIFCRAPDDEAKEYITSLLDQIRSKVQSENEAG